MAQQSRSPHESIPHELYVDSDHEVLLFPTRLAACDPIDLPAQSAGRPATGPRARVTTDALRQVMVTGVAARLSDVVEDLDRAAQPAQAERPPGVVYHLTAVLGGLAERGHR